MSKVNSTCIRMGLANPKEFSVGRSLGAALYLKACPEYEHPMNDKQRSYFRAVKHGTIGSLYDQYKPDEIPEWLDNMDFAYALGKSVGKCTEAHMQRKFIRTSLDALGCIKVVTGGLQIASSVNLPLWKEKLDIDNMIKEYPDQGVMPEDLKKCIRVNDNVNTILYGAGNMLEGIALLYLASSFKDKGWK